MNFKLAKNKIVMAIVIVTGGLVIVGNGCSRFLTSEGSSSNSADSYHGDSVSDPSANPGDIHVIIGAPTSATIYAKNALQSIERQLWVNASTTSIGTYEVKRGTISQTGSVVTFTAPMSMAITSIVADVCNDVINHQASLQPNQRFFRDFNLSAAGKPTRAAMEFSIRALSLAVWNRQPDSVEMQTLIDFMEDLVLADEVNGQRKTALGLCAVVNSTTDAIIR